jgi:hypothetical protein
LLPFLYVGSSGLKLRHYISTPADFLRNSAGFKYFVPNKLLILNAPHSSAFGQINALCEPSTLDEILQHHFFGFLGYFGTNI